MKILVLALILLALIAPALGTLTNEQAAYFKGVDFGYRLGTLHLLGQGNATAAQEYNSIIQGYNDYLNQTLNETDASAQQMAFMPLPDNSWQPKVIREWNGTNPWE